MKRYVVLALIGALVLGGVAFGGYHLRWWLREEAVNRTAEIQRDSFERQETLRDQVVAQAADLAALDVQLANPSLPDETAAALEGQRIAMARQLCSLAADLVGDVTPTVADVIAEEC
jgi:hypothetical protein